MKGMIGAVDESDGFHGELAGVLRLAGFGRPSKDTGFTPWTWTALRTRLT
jgi:hypothetical protein